MSQSNLQHWYYAFRQTALSSSKQGSDLLNTTETNVITINNNVSKTFGGTTYQMVPIAFKKRTAIIGAKAIVVLGGTFFLYLVSTTNVEISLFITNLTTNTVQKTIVSGGANALRVFTVTFVSNQNYEILLTQTCAQPNESLYIQSSFSGTYSPMHQPYANTKSFAIVSPSTPVSVGDYKYSARAADFDGWLLCDGRAVSRSDFAYLFAVIGTYFGNGDGTATFNLPDNRGRATASIGQGAGLTNRQLGAAIGEETHALTQSELPAHTHTGTTDSTGTHSHTYQDAYFAEYQQGGGVFGTSANTDYDNNFRYRTADGSYTNTPANINTSSEGAHAHTFTTASQGGGGSHNNMQPTLFIGNLFICAEI
jgi:microcystin-dependent protein